MIGLLRGRLVESDADGTLIVDVSGVGYELVSPLGTAGRAGTDDAGDITLQVHTHVREDALVLFGFATRDERTAFRTLITISKVGPKLALSVLGSVSVGELATLVESGHSAALTKIPGIGKKTAERMVLELKGKLGAMAVAGQASAARPAGKAAGRAQQSAVLQEALVRMGFKSAEAERAVGALADLDRPMGELIREALAGLSP